jgi:hypothetical protein
LIARAGKEKARRRANGNRAKSSYMLNMRNLSHSNYTVNDYQEWQADYAAHGIATFPVSSDKKPMVKHYSRFGLVSSTNIARRFADAPAIGLMCGKRNRLTVLDVDTKDERVLADAVERHGQTPIVIRTGSGNYQAWYRHGGERRLIRPRPDEPIDILGGGLVVAPPSQVSTGSYQFIQGSLDDLDSLPTLNDAPSIIPPETRSDWGSMGQGAGRNFALFRRTARAAHHCDDFDQLLDYAQTQNSKFGEPMADSEVMKVATSVWKMQSEGRNRFGQHGAYVPLDLVRKLARTEPDALALYNVLKAENGPSSIFPIANAMAQTSINVGWRRFRQARKLIIELGLVEMVSPDTQRLPAQYRWPKPRTLQ